ncbi:YceD family protein [Pseudophaeobacter sp.]|uniref:YceD family protein n=1 Tax=Pseudophaeobacter sp. TaxID=1971739 RepID=UPI0040597AEC
MSDSTALRVSDLPQNRPTAFDLRPDAQTLETLAYELDIKALRKLRFTGNISAKGKRDWQVTATLGATILQDCVVTLEPVTTRIDQKVERIFVCDYSEPDDPDVEMEADDRLEPLGEMIAPHEIMVEALALLVPAYPRKEGAELGETVYSQPGVTPLRDEDTKPFAGLAALKDQLKPKDDA